jgi:hypothetical protein
MLAAAVAAVGLSTAASALTVTLSDVLQGYTGALELKFNAFNEGRLYSVANGDYGRAAGVVGTAAQITAINALDGSSIAPTGGNTAQTNGGEDSWTVFKLTTIQGFDAFGAYTLWDESTLVGGKKISFRGIYWGEQDTSLKQTGAGTLIDPTTQVIEGVNLQFAIYLIEGTASSVLPPFSALPFGPIARTTPTATPWLYPTVSDVAGSALVWTAVGAVNPLTGVEFQTTVTLTPTGVIASGGGKGAGDWATNAAGTGLWNSSMNTLLTPDLTIGFNIANSTPHGDWDAYATDPLNTAVIPTPAAAWGGLVLAGIIGMNVYRRRRTE